MVLQVLYLLMHDPDDQPGKGFMLTGKRFKLRKPTLAFNISNINRAAVAVPAGTILRVVSGPSSGDRKIEVLWNCQVVTMFAYDLSKSGTEI